MEKVLGAYHPTIWKFIDGLKKEQSLNELRVEQYIAGQQPPASKRIYKESAMRIKAIVNDYTGRPLLDYLRGVAHNFQFHI